MASLFSKPKFPDPPKISDEEVENERRRQLANQKSGGKQGTTLTGGAGVSAPILGSAAALTGGL
jgi:hypothetical protein